MSIYILYIHRYYTCIYITFSFFDSQGFSIGINANTSLISDLCQYFETVTLLKTPAGNLNSVTKRHFTF